MKEHDTYSQKREVSSARPIPYGLLCFFIFAGLGAVAFGALLIVQNVNEPFAFRAGSTQTSALPDLDSQEPSKEALRSSDTDQDTLSDYDELYVYRTSMYLKDTDSDGYDDKQEIASGHDPNCASGKNCFEPILTGTSTPEDFKRGLMSGPLANIFGGNPPQSLYDIGSLSVEQIKELLKSQGITDEQLKGVDDKALIDLYQKTYADFIQTYENPQSSSGLSQPQSSAGKPIVIDEAKLANPENLTADEIRELIRRAGTMPEEQLQQVDDSTLKEVFLKSIKAAQQTQQ